MLDTEYLSLIDANKKMKSASWIKFCIPSNFQKINSSFVESRAKMNNVGNNSLIKKERNAYDDLFKAYDSLQRENFAIMAKNKSSIKLIKALKNEIATLKLRAARPRTNNRESISTMPTVIDHSAALVTTDNNAATDNNVENALLQLQQRLISAEEKLQILHSTPMTENRTGTTDTVTSDMATQLHVLQSQQELDQMRLQAQSEKLEKILSSHNEYKVRYTALRDRLRQCEAENESLKAQELQITELREHNLFLETKMIELSKVVKPENQRVRAMIQQMEECELLRQDNINLRMSNEKLQSQIDGCNYALRQELDHAQQQIVEKEAEIQHQASCSQALQKQLQETNVLHQEIINREQSIDELTSKAERRLQRIRIQESQTAIDGTNNAMNLEGSVTTIESSHRNSLEVVIHGASNLKEGKETFILLDFHTYTSELSNIAFGEHPKYNFSVTYNLEGDDGVISHLLSTSCVHIEIYLLREDSSTRLFGCASVSTSTLVSPPALTRLPTLALLSPHNDGVSVGSLDLTLQLTRPIPYSD